MLDLVESTPSEEAKAAAISRLALGPPTREMDAEPPEPVEPPIEGLPPKDKPIAEYSDEESAAVRASFDRTMRKQMRREERERREAQEREQDQANRSDEQRFADVATAALTPDAKRAANLAMIEGIHPGEGEGQV